MYRHSFTYFFSNFSFPQSKTKKITSPIQTLLSISLEAKHEQEGWRERAREVEEGTKEEERVVG